MRVLVLVFAGFVSGLAMPAEASAPHLTVGQLRLGALAPLQLQLSAPCFGCRAKASAAPSAAPSVRLPAPPRGASPASVRAQRISNALYIGDTWRLGGGRELSLHLTPNEGHCAPLMRLTF